MVTFTARKLRAAKKARAPQKRVSAGKHCPAREVCAQSAVTFAPCPQRGLRFRPANRLRRQANRQRRRRSAWIFLVLHPSFSSLGWPGSFKPAVLKKAGCKKGWQSLQIANLSQYAASKPSVQNQCFLTSTRPRGARLTFLNRPGKPTRAGAAAQAFASRKSKANLSRSPFMVASISSSVILFSPL